MLKRRQTVLEPYPSSIFVLIFVSISVQCILLIEAKISLFTSNTAFGHIAFTSETALQI